MQRLDILFLVYFCWLYNEVKVHFSAGYLPVEIAETFSTFASKSRDLSHESEHVCMYIM